MQTQNRYIYDENQPITNPYSQKQVYNAYFKGIDTFNNNPVLVSVFKQKNYDRMVAKLKRIKELKQIRHPNLAQIYDVFLDKDKKILQVILEWCEGGSLYEYQKSQNTFDSKFTTNIVNKIAKALRQIHNANKFHRYVNMENIQFNSQGQPILTFKCLYPKAIYLSPDEKKGIRSPSNDIFSLGVLTYKLLYSSIPFRGNNIEEQNAKIRQGVKFPKGQNQMFPVSINHQIKQLISGMTLIDKKNLEAHEIVEITDKMQSKLNKLEINEQKLQSILKGKYLVIIINQSDKNEHRFLALEKQKKNIVQIQVIESLSFEKLKRYSQSLKVFSNKKPGLVSIQQKYFIGKNTLVLITKYYNQGSLTYYLNNGGSIAPTKMKQSNLFQQIKQKIQNYQSKHNYICFDSFLIRRGQINLKYPPFHKENFLKRLGNDDKIMIAPQIQKGQQSQNADSWSLGVIKYLIEHNEAPSFKKNKQVILPSKHMKSRQQIEFYENFLKYNPKDRKNIFKQKQDELEKIPEFQIIPKDPKVEKKAKNKKKLEAIKKNIQNNKPSPLNKKTCGQSISQKLVIFQPLQKHWTKPVRVGIKIFIGLIYLIFLFYWNFFIINGQLLTEHSLYQAKVVHIRAFENDSTPYIEYNLVTKTPTQTYKLFYNQTLTVLRDDYKCVLNDYSVQSNVVQIINRSSFTAYQIFGILFSIINLIIFCLKLSKMDFPKAYFISQIQQNNFQPLWNWLYLNLCMVTQISFIYLLYGSLFHMLLQPCLSKATLTAVEFLLKDWQFSFAIRYSWIYIGLLITYILSILLIIRPKTKIHRILKIVLIILYLTGAFCRIMGQSGGYIAWEKQSVFGKLGELLGLIIGVTFLVIDLIFGCNLLKLKKEENNGNKIMDESKNEFNITEENLLDD